MGRPTKTLSQFNQLHGLGQANPMLNLNHIGWGQMSQDTLVPSAKLAKKKLSRFEEARRSLIPLLHSDEENFWYYEQVAASDVIAALGWFNPMLGGRPKHFAQKMLEGIPSPVPGKGYNWKTCGLMYFTAHIAGRRRSRNRTSTSGLALLKHWADMFPRFRPFFEAYHSKKAEMQITLECVDLAMGIEPPGFKRAKQMDLEARIKLEKERAKQVQMDQMAKMQMAMTDVAAQGYQSAMDKYQAQIMAQNQQGLFGSIFGNHRT